MKASFDYDRDLDPPGPVLPVRYSAPGGGAGVLIRSLLDTGADLCVIPVEIAHDLSLPLVGVADVEKIGDRPVRAEIFAAVLEFANTSQIVEVLALPGDSLIGRNALNRWNVRLEGPRGRLTIEG